MPSNAGGVYPARLWSGRHTSRTAGQVRAAMVPVCGSDQKKQTRPYGKWIYGDSFIPSLLWATWLNEQRQAVDRFLFLHIYHHFLKGIFGAGIFIWGWTKNQTVGMNYMKHRCEYYRKLFNIHWNICEGCGKIPVTLCTLASVSTIPCPDCVLTSLSPFCLTNSYSCFMTQLKYVLIQDELYNSDYHPDWRRPLLSGLPQSSGWAPSSSNH